jgi:hypothetical protein
LNTIVINGFITSDPGPYQVVLSLAFDIESKESLRNPVTAKHVVIMDNAGQSEELTESTKGIYATKPDGIQGIIGRTYMLRVELTDGRVYESIPDTLLEAGNIDSIYSTFTEHKDATTNSTQYGFDVMFLPSISSERNYHFMWKFTGTFQSKTNPEYGTKEPCAAITCEGCNTCNYKPLCSGIRNISKFPGIDRAVFVRVHPCECCDCWYNFFNSQPLLSADQIVEQGKFAAQKAVYIPLEGWTFQYKVHAKVTQYTLSRQAFDFWKGVKDQKTAINSLFQPVSGKIKGNFVQVSGQPVLVEGLFFAAGVASKATFIERGDVKPGVPIPEPGIIFDDSCLKLFPYGTTQEPAFWN